MDVCLFCFIYKYGPRTCAAKTYTMLFQLCFVHKYNAFNLNSINASLHTHAHNYFFNRHI